MTRISALLAAAVVCVPLAAVQAAPAGAAAADPSYLDRGYAPAERAADLVSRLTLAEKAAQMNSSQAAAIPRLGIPAYGWWNEAGHGVAREGTRNGGGPPTLINTTSYPVDLSLGATWNPELVYREASMISDEVREVFRNNTLNLSLYSPTINLARDPRWGRNDEAFSEDPLLTAELAAQFVNGLQGQTPQGRPQSAGEDLNCNAGYKDGKNYANTIPAAVAKHITTFTRVYNENDVDVSLVRLFTARIATGEFDAEDQVPWVAAARRPLAPGTWTNAEANNAVTETPERLAMARAVAAEGIVLLKNKPALLPLRVPATGAYRVAVLGSYANPGSMYLGGYSSIQGAAGVAKSVTAYAGLKAAVQAVNPAATVDFLPGTVPGDIGTIDTDSVAAAAGYDTVIVHAGTDATTARESHDRTDLALPGAHDPDTGRYRVDQGRYGLRVGSSSADPAVRSRTVVKVTGALHPTPEFVTPRPVVAGDAAAGISQRVSFLIGSRIDPQLTVSLSDESLAGYRTLGRSTPLRSGPLMKTA